MDRMNVYVGDTVMCFETVASWLEHLDVELTVSGDHSTLTLSSPK